MTVLAISPRELHEKVTRRGCVLVRTGKHAVYQAPTGRKFTMPGYRAGKKHTTITGAIVRSAAQALGVTTKELLQ